MEIKLFIAEYILEYNSISIFYKIVGICGINNVFIEKLAEKAIQRNPDEFYHKMVNTQVKDGEH